MTNRIAEACSRVSLTLENTNHPELVMLLQMAASEIERLENSDRMRPANDLLRSAYQIAKRDGADTNWPAFAKRLESELVAQSVLIFGTPNIAAATCTPKTFRLSPGE